jgi:hypothetical protein
VPVAARRVQARFLAGPQAAAVEVLLTGRAAAPELAAALERVVALGRAAARELVAAPEWQAAALVLRIGPAQPRIGLW